MLSKIKEFVKEHQSEIILFLGVILACFFSFFLGYIMAKIEEKEPIKIELLEDGPLSARGRASISLGL